MFLAFRKEMSMKKIFITDPMDSNRYLVLRSDQLFDKNNKIKSTAKSSIFINCETVPVGTYPDEFQINGGISKTIIDFITKSDTNCIKLHIGDTEILMYISDTPPTDKAIPFRQAIGNCLMQDEMWYCDNYYNNEGKHVSEL